MGQQQVLDSLNSTGLSEEPQEMVVFTDEPKIPGYLSFPNEKCSGKYFTDGVIGQGYDPDETTAKVKSVAEFLERLCLFNPQTGGLTSRHRYDENRDFVNPAVFLPYSEEQIDTEEYTNRAIRGSYRWVRCRNVTANRTEMVPAQIIFLSNEFDDEFPILKESISTGAALGESGSNHALDGGLLEVIERDACIHSYLTKRTIRKVANTPRELQELDDYLNRYRLETNHFDVTSDLGVPTVMTVTVDRSGIGPAVNVGSGAAFVYHYALRHAVLESLHCRRHARVMRGIEFPDGFPSEDEVTSLDRRFYYWYPKERISDLDFWVDEPPETDYESLAGTKTNRESVLKRMKDMGWSLYVADITLPEARDAGFEVLKVIAPQAHPLYLDERAKALYSAHYGTIPDNAKLKPHPLT